VRVYGLRHKGSGQVLQHDDGHMPRHIDFDGEEVPLIHEDQEMMESECRSLGKRWIYNPENKYGYLFGPITDYEIVEFELNIINTFDLTEVQDQIPEGEGKG